MGVENYCHGDCKLFIDSFKKILKCVLLLGLQIGLTKCPCLPCLRDREWQSNLNIGKQGGQSENNWMLEKQIL